VAQNANLCYNIRFLQLTLPTGFHSWTQVLTDWGVSRAYQQAAHPPRCFAARPELAAPFVADVSAAIREKQLHRRAVQVALVCQSVTEPAHDRSGGTAYLDLRSAMGTAQDRYLSAYRTRHASDDGSTSPELNPLRAEMEQHQTAFLTARRRHEPFVQNTRAASARAYWSTLPARGLPDTFFADAAAHTAPARMQRIHPPWWGPFLGRLQHSFEHGHPAEGCLLDALPRLRQDAKKKTLAALITEWREENADRWGWYANTHYRMLSLRAAKKAAQVTTWFNARAPGYLTNEAVRLSLHTELADRLAASDPWSVSPPSGLNALFSEHGRN
jgi:hypothetical protein